MELKWVEGKVIIECSPLEGRILQAGANLLSHDLDNLDEEEVLNNWADGFKCSREEMYEAVEKCIITLPHEDNTWWDTGEKEEEA